MPKKTKNAYLGSSIDEHIKQKYKDNEFAQSFDMEQEKLKLARRVKQLREQQNLTQTELAEIIGTKQPSIARLENGHYWPRIDVLEKIALALGKHLEIRFTKKAA
ncbi:MAG: helix-turn-helix domain-containing protein [Myxococcales bacterium]|nr:helix-turn-helix domain-containing protein [Myxococcales bacterium]USN51646.1 MAG: helix-turn-helix domain-containing protein [Myxococcales bacterium]